MMNTQEEKEAKNNYTGVIYLLKNKINNKKYIGMTTRQINIRLSEHKYDATHDYRNKQHRHLYKAINKYGFENFECTILESVYCENKEDLIEQLRELEKEYIKTFNTRDKNIGYNLTDGGEGTIGYKISEEQREKMSKARKGRKVSDETKEKIGEFMRSDKNPNRGKCHSDETKRKISEANKGKLSGDKNPMYGKSRPDLSQRNRESGFKVNQIDIHSNTIIHTWNFLREIERHTGFSRSSITDCCKGITKQSHGYRWEIEKKAKGGNGNGKN